MAITSELDNAIKSEIAHREDGLEVVYDIIDRCLDEIRADDGHIHNDRVKLIIDMLLPDDPTEMNTLEIDVF